MSPEDVQHVLDRVRARMPVAPSTMEAALEYIGERWAMVTVLNREMAVLKSELTARIEEVSALKKEVEEWTEEAKKRERPVQSDDEPEPNTSRVINLGCLRCGGWGCTRCKPNDCKPEPAPAPVTAAEPCAGYPGCRCSRCD